MNNDKKQTTNNYYDEELDSLIKQLETKYTGKDYPVVTNKKEVYNCNAKFSRIRKEKKLKKMYEISNKNKLDLKYRTTSMNDQRRYKVAQAESNVGPIEGARQGVEMMSREVTSLGQRPMYTDDHQLSDATIKEMAWDLSRIMERPTLVGSYAWTPASDFLASRNIPLDVIPVKLAQIPFVAFQYWRGDVVLRLQIAGSPLVQGILAMTFIPLCDSKTATDISKDISSLTINPTVYLYANSNTMAELRIPYNHPLAYIRTKGPNNDIQNSLGVVVIYVLEALKAVDAVKQVSVSLFSFMENSEFKVPRLSSLMTFPATAESGLLTGALSALTSIGGSMIAPVVSQLTGTAKDKVARKSKRGKGAMIEEFTSKAMPDNFIGDTIDMVGEALGGVLGFMGLDNPTVPVESERTIVKANGSMNYCVGPEHIEKMSLMPQSLPLTTAETFGTVVDEMDMSYLYSKYSYMGRFEINVSDGVAAIVASYPLSPYPTIQNIGGSMTPLNTEVQYSVYFPLLSYLGLPFRYWTGGLTYKFLVSASSLHTCKLFVSFNYGNPLVEPPTTLQDVTSQYGLAIEISQGSNEFEFTAPYVASTPYKEIFTGVVNENNTMGIMRVSVMNPLVAPPAVAPSISVAVFICGANDFSYELIGGGNNLMPVVDIATSAPRPSVENQATRHLRDVSSRHYYRVATVESGVVDEQTVTPMNIAPTITDTTDYSQEDQVAPPQVEDTVDDHFGITSISVRNMLKRYQYIGDFEMIKSPINPTTNFCMVTIRDLMHVAKMGLYPGTTSMCPKESSLGMMSWAAAMYRQFKGSLRIKAVLNGNYANSSAVPVVATNTNVYWLPGPYPYGYPPDYEKEMILNMPFVAGSGTMINGNDVYTRACTTPKLTILNGVTSNVLEFEIPFSTNKLSTLTYSDTELTGVEYYDFGRLYFYTNVPMTNGKTNLSVYVAFGDEARFGTLYRIPKVFVPCNYTIDTALKKLIINGNVGMLMQYPTGASDSLDFEIANAESAVRQMDSVTLKAKYRDFCNDGTGKTAHDICSYSKVQSGPDMNYYNFMLRTFIDYLATSNDICIRGHRFTSVATVESGIMRSNSVSSTGSSRAAPLGGLKGWLKYRVKGYLLHNPGVSIADVDEYVLTLAKGNKTRAEKFIKVLDDKTMNQMGVYLMGNKVYCNKSNVLKQKNKRTNRRRVYNNHGLSKVKQRGTRTLPTPAIPEESSWDTTWDTSTWDSNPDAINEWGLKG
jgi:hypothetical protein